MSDYISREALLDKTVNKNNAWLYTTNAEGKNLKEIVDSIPSADVRENIHARWESDGHGHIICTACKGAKLNTHRSKFCDSCGAIMDGERQCERCLYHKENGCTRWVCIDAEVESKPIGVFKCLNDSVTGERIQDMREPKGEKGTT